MSNKFAEMSLEGFCDYVSSNPGGARKAFELRKKSGGDCGGAKRVVEKVVEKVVYKDRVVEKRVEVPITKIEYRDRMVVKEVEKEVEVKQKRKPLRAVVVGSVWFLSCLWCVGSGMSAGERVEVPVEVVKEVPVEVVKEVEVIREVKVEVPVEVVRTVEVERSGLSSRGQRLAEENSMLRAEVRRLSRGNQSRVAGEVVRGVFGLLR